MKTETMEEFLARGGQIVQLKPAPIKFDHSSKYRKDKQLQALLALRKQVDNDDLIKEVDEAICIRLEILKSLY